MVYGYFNASGLICTKIDGYALVIGSFPMRQADWPAFWTFIVSIVGVYYSPHLNRGNLENYSIIQ